MKRNVISIFSIVLFLATCGCGGREALLIVEGVSGQYNVKDQILFKIENRSKSIIYFKIGVQTKIDGNWRETVPDIYRKDYEKRVLLENLINPKEIKSIRWPDQTSDVFKLQAGNHRFVIFYIRDSKNTYLNLLTPDAVHESFPALKIYSREFEIR